MYYINPQLINLERIVYQNNRRAYLRLDLNENPGGLPQEFINAVLEEVTSEFVSQYPETKEFTECLANFLHVEENNLCLVNGSSEGIRYIIEAFTSPNGKIVGVVPSYAMYEVYAEMYGRKFIRVNYNDDLSICPEQIIENLDTSVQLLILLNPNNPIGNAYTNEEFEKIMKRAHEYKITVIVDEAYMYFYNNTFIEYALKMPHVFVTRTFSKLFSMAGCRLGYIVGQPDDVKIISKLCTPHNTNAFAMLLAQRAIEKEGLLDEIIRKQLEGKKYVVEELKKNGYKVHAKEGNFIFVKAKYKDPDALVKEMKETKKILIKTYDNIGNLGKCLRVTTAEEKFMKKFVEALLELDY